MNYQIQEMLKICSQMNDSGNFDVIDSAKIQEVANGQIAGLAKEVDKWVQQKQQQQIDQQQKAHQAVNVLYGSNVQQYPSVPQPQQQVQYPSVPQVQPGQLKLNWGAPIFANNPMGFNKFASF